MEKPHPYGVFPYYRLGSLGNVRTTTLKEFTTEEFAEIVKKLP
jgi:uncharacterized protein with GYD domain